MPSLQIRQTPQSVAPSSGRRSSRRSSCSLPRRGPGPAAAEVPQRQLKWLRRTRWVVHLAASQPAWQWSAHCHAWLLLMHARHRHWRCRLSGPSSCGWELSYSAGRVWADALRKPWRQRPCHHPPQQPPAHPPPAPLLAGRPQLARLRGRNRSSRPGQAAANTAAVVPPWSAWHPALPMPVWLLLGVAVAAPHIWWTQCWSPSSSSQLPSAACPVSLQRQAQAHTRRVPGWALLSSPSLLCA